MNKQELKIYKLAQDYLGYIHANLTEGQLIDLHTFFYHLDLQSCPVCNEWLIQRSKPEATV